jgi:hypothetical protein
MQISSFWIEAAYVLRGIMQGAATGSPVLMLKEPL